MGVIGCIRWLVLAVGLASGLPSLAQTAGAVIMETSGTVTVQVGDGPAQPLKAGQPLRPGMIVESGPNASVVLAFPDGQVCVLGEGSTFRMVSYNFDPKDTSKSAVSLNLIDGSMRIVMGEIAQTNPAGVRIQIGTATLGVVPSQSATTDASVSVQGGQVAVTVQEGRVEARLPTGSPQEISSGQALFVGLDGAARRGTTAQIIQQLGQVSQGQNLQRQLGVLQGYSQKISQTVGTLAGVTSALKNVKDPAAAQKIAESAAAQEILKQLASLPPTAEISPPQVPPPPALVTSGTPPSGGAGGGTPCGASCN